jgi:DNA polymerase-4
MTIFHIDMDSYFASVEQQARPWLRGKPIVVSGRPDIHSVVAAASKEAKRYGIKAGMSTWEAKKLCPEVIFVPGDPDKYESVTRRFLGILISYTPMVEVYSIDEVFLDATEILPRYPDPIALALEIKRKFREELGEWITCTIGIAPNKLLAKLATEEAKPNGIKWIRPEDVPEVLRNTPVEAVCGIGPRIAKRLSYMGVWTLADLGKIPEAYLKRVFGVYGTLLHLWGVGVDPTPLKPYWQEEEEKSIGHSHALPKSLRHPEGARRVLYYLSVKTARRLRKKGFVGRVIHAMYRDEEMKYFGAQKALSTPTCDERRIFDVAMEIVERLGGFPYGVSLVGVRVAGLERISSFPYPLFPEEAKRERLLSALDRIRDRFGEEAVIPASALDCQLLVGATGGLGREREIARAVRAS